MTDERNIRPLTVAIAAMGGQGGGVLAEWLIDVAEHAGYLAQSTSVPGVAQRTGATVYYLEFFPADAVSGGREPVMALMPVPGDVDVVIAGELVEAARAVVRGIVTPDRTTVVTSSHRDYALSEKMQMGDGRADDATIVERIEASAQRLVAVDMAALAEDTGSVISAVMLGAVAGARIAPFTYDACREAIRRGGVAVDRNLAGFEAGYGAADEGGERTPKAIAETPVATHPALPEAAAALLEDAETRFPAEALETIRLGLTRVMDFQDPKYGRLYLDRLRRIAELDSGSELTRETARYLALWMTFEDPIRVAELKTRRSRFERFRREVRAAPEQIVQVSEFMHPRVEEICDTLPAGLGRFVLNTPALRRFLGLFCRGGRKIRTTSMSGFLLLYTVAGLRRWRRGTLRYRREQVEIENWLERIANTAPRDAALARELAECQRLIKGYGDTHERGMRSYRAILEYLDSGGGTGGDAASRVRALREAALADESGAELAKALERAA